LKRGRRVLRAPTSTESSGSSLLSRNQPDRERTGRIAFTRVKDLHLYGTRSPFISARERHPLLPDAAGNGKTQVNAEGGERPMPTRHRRKRNQNCEMCTIYKHQDQRKDACLRGRKKKLSSCAGRSDLHKRKKSGPGYTCRA